MNLRNLYISQGEVLVSPTFSKSCLALTLCSLYSAHASAQTQPLELDNMVVTASGFSQQIKDAPASISVITREQIENKSYRDVTDALRDVPGVVVTVAPAPATSAFAAWPPSTP